MAREKEVQKEPKKSKKWMFIAGIPLLILIVAGGGVGAYFLGATGGGGGSLSASADGPETGARTLGPLVEMETLVVNIPHRDSSRFLKLGITLETADVQAKGEIEDRMAQIRDAAILLAGNRSFDDIRDLQGKKQLKADLKGRINELAGPEKVRDLFFTDFVVQ